MTVKVWSTIFVSIFFQNVILLLHKNKDLIIENRHIFYYDRRNADEKIKRECDIKKDEKPKAVTRYFIIDLKGS